MLHAKALRAKYPRARVVKVDLTRALAHPECARILTAKDVPFNKTGHLVPDWDVMIAEGGITRYVGDAIVLAASERREALDEILALVDVGVRSAHAASDPGGGDGGGRAASPREGQPPL